MLKHIFSDNRKDFNYAKKSERFFLGKPVNLGKIFCLIAIILIVFGMTECRSAYQPSDCFSFLRDPASGPVVSSGSAGWPMFPTDPAVIKDEQGYHLFYTSLFCKANGIYYYSWDAGDISSCDIMDVVAAVGYAFSSDGGYTWEFRGSPVILGGIEPWCKDIETPHVAVLGDTLYLFYSALGEYQGQPFSQRYEIGAATLDLNGESIRQRLLVDLAEFTIRPEPLLPYNVSSSSFDNNTQEPSVVVRNGIFEVFYVGIGFSLPDQPIDASGQSITSVGMAKALFDSELQLVEKSSGYILPNANITEVKYFDAHYHLFSTTLEDGEFHENERINYFQSGDGETWLSYGILLSPGATFDNWGVMAPTVVVEENEIVMFYTGWSIENHPCFPEPLTPDTRFGRPSDNDTKCIYGSIGRAVAERLPPAE
ncbi:MAG: hypothetical protein P8Y62_07860 [candidate division WOR-3 bacterium]